MTAGKKGILFLMKSPLGHLIPDKVYLSWKLRLLCGQKMDWENPKLFSEKMQWLKVNDRKPIYTTMADKYAAKEWMKEKIGGEYVVPLLGVWDNADEIDFSKLPQKFVLKTTHDSHGVVICMDKENLDIEKTIRFLNRRLKKNYYWMSREWCYKNIKPRIIAEVFLEDKTGLQSNGMVDYKLFMFNGELNFIMTCTERSSKGPLRNYFEADWSPLVRQGIPMENETSEVIPKPKNLSKMVEIAKTLSEDTRLLRVDFYEVNGELYVGEVTFFTLGGFKNYVPSVYNEIFGNNLKL